MEKMDRISKHLVNAVYLKIAPNLQKVTEVWSELGISEDEQDVEAAQFTDSVEHILSRMLDNKLEEVKSLRRKLLEEAESYGLHVIELTKMLDVPNIEPDETLKLIQLRDFLKIRVTELEALRNERAVELEKLRCEEKKLADFLGEFPLTIVSNVLTFKTLDDVRENIEKLQNEKLKRKELFRTMRKQLFLVMEALEHTANTTLEMDIVSDKEGTFHLTELNMNATKALLEKFEREINLNETEAKTLLESIRSLWNVLEVETNFQEKFLKQNVGHCPSTIRTLRDELKRCKDIKMKNARQYVEKVRSELNHMWNRCYFSRPQQKAFKAFTSVDFNEEVVDVHDIELQKMKEIRNEGEDIFTKFEKRAELWNRMQQLDNKANDPKRLMNRGGQLLKEEKERKRLQALIPKLETDLEADVSKWESEKEKVFLVYGTPIMNFIQNQWKVYQEEKENEKLARQAAKGKNMEDDFACSSRNNVSRKRLLATPVKDSRSKLAKLTPLVRNDRKPPISSGKMTQRNMMRVTRRQQSAVRERDAQLRTQPNKVVDGGASNTIFDFKLSGRVVPNLSSTSQLSTYSDFENNIMPPLAVGLTSTMTAPCSSTP